MSSSKRIVSYCDPLAAQPGDEVRFMVSSLDAEPFDSQLVRLICGDISPGGHGYEEIECESPLNARYEGKPQRLRQGSSAVVPPSPFFAELEGLRVELCAFPTLADGTRTLIACSDERGGFALELREGVVRFVVRGDDGDLLDLAAESPILQRRWTRITASYDPEKEEMRLSVVPLVTAPGDRATARRWVGQRKVKARVRSCGPVTFAARMKDSERDQHFDGKLDACSLGSDPYGEPEVRWDFSLDIGTEHIRDVGPHQLHGRTMQLPARAVPGVEWTGEVHDWTVDRRHYGAIHFHSDDIADAEWETTCRFIIPPDLQSGVYGLRSRTESSEDYAVFFVSPGPEDSSAKVAWLASTITYRAYANVRLNLSPELIFGSWAEGEVSNDRFLMEHPECGLSCYEIHADGHGVANSSHKRPVMNLKPKGGVWSFTADTNILAWLDRTRVPHDVITDDVLHECGRELLDRYQVIVTGTHPEYWTTPMLDALEGWLSRGGRLMVMGANGFYWRTGVRGSPPHAVEVRRAEDGARAWISEPGEYVMETSGELGGLWRRIGRPPNRVAGSGFAAQGFSTSGHYRRSDAWTDPRVAFAVEGLSDRDLLGDHGIVGGGAAGQEIDRFDETLGSPSHSIILASSEGHPPDMLQTKEEFAATGIPIPGTAVRADVVFFETPMGGAVFSTGSIAWAGSLATNDYDNDVAKLSTNVLKRFADETPFEVPQGVTRPKGLPQTASEEGKLW